MTSNNRPGPTLVDRFAMILATSGGIGFIPMSPGTFGSLPGLALGACLAGGLPLLIPEATLPTRWFLTAIALGASILLALWAIQRTERAWSVHDDKRIVIDEVVGQAITVAFVPPSFMALATGFMLFRLLDIWKPSAIGYIDRHAPGAIGTLFDDVLAGVIAGLIVCLLF